MVAREPVLRAKGKPACLPDRVYEQGRSPSKIASIKAKYKIAKVDTDEQAATFHYCFNCAIPLVKQGFIV